MLAAIKHALLGAVVSAALFAVYSLARQGVDFSSWRSVETFFVIAVIGGIVTLVAGIMVRRQAPSLELTHRIDPWTEPANPNHGPLTKKHRTIPAMRARLSPKFRWLSVSPALQAFLHTKAAILRTQSLLTIVHPEDVPLLESTVRETVAGSKAKSIEVKLLVDAPVNPNRNGAIAKTSDTDVLPTHNAKRIYHVLLKIWPRVDQNGKIRFLDCAIRDRTKQARVQRTLANATAKLEVAQRQYQLMKHDLRRFKESYRELYDNAPVMYFRVDAQGRLVTFNKTLLRTLGYTRDELVQRPYKTLLAPAALAAWEKGHQARQNNGMGWRMEDDVETHWQAKSGAVLDVWIRSTPDIDDNGAVIRFRSVALDLTERNRLANELRTRGDELERTNNRLRHINVELESFTHVVSHDLKEPLRTLQAYSNVLAEDFSGQLGPDGFQYINHLIQSSRRLGSMIDDLLKLSQAGRIKGTPQIFNLNEVLATVRSDLAGLIQRKQATVLTKGSLPTVTGDQPRIAQLLTNLITNGLKYNTNAAPEVVIGQVPLTDAPGAPPDIVNGHAVIYVRDNGIGVDPVHHQKIFGIFRRLHNGDEYEGTGAGLAICKKIVDGHGGRIWIQSELGNGATFYFTLPFAPAMDVIPPARGNAAAQTSIALADGDRGEVVDVTQVPSTWSETTILLVEDKVDMGLLIQRLCKKAGCRVTYFTNAEEAWDYLQDHEPDLLLLDINLPGMTGIDLCKKIRGELERSEVPIVLFSDKQEREELDELHAAGASFILSKNLLIEPTQWQQKMKAILAARLAPEGRHG